MREDGDMTLGGRKVKCYPQFSAELSDTMQGHLGSTLKDKESERCLVGNKEDKYGKGPQINDKDGKLQLLPHPLDLRGKPAGLYLLPSNSLSSS